ncbi:MAG TPA: DUF937 domain-containing protein [Candidatus Limnocylindria bacterium]|nr:DUF937 domain-containing protein [Candidatus Limnocylindria bacterium]
MAELSDTLNQLLESHAGQISQRIDADPNQTRSAIDAAVPALLAALGDEAERGGGLQQAIAQDHDGAIIDQLSDYLDGRAQLSPRTTNGSGILNHALGDRQEPMAQALSARSGLDMSTIMRLLPLLAPIVMGMLGKKSSSAGGGSGGGFGMDDLGSILGREKADARSKNPDIGDILDSFSKGSGSKSGGGIGDVLGGLLGDKGK